MSCGPLSSAPDGLNEFLLLVPPEPDFQKIAFLGTGGRNPYGPGCWRGLKGTPENASPAGRIQGIRVHINPREQETATARFISGRVSYRFTRMV